MNRAALVGHEESTTRDDVEVGEAAGLADCEGRRSFDEGSVGGQDADGLMFTLGERCDGGQEGEEGDKVQADRHETSHLVGSVE